MFLWIIKDIFGFITIICPRDYLEFGDLQDLKSQVPIFRTGTVHLVAL